MAIDGTIVAEIPNPAVPKKLLEELWHWKQNGVSIEDSIDRIRPRTVPTGYSFSNWRPGMHSNNLLIDSKSYLYLIR